METPPSSPTLNASQFEKDFSSHVHTIFKNYNATQACSATFPIQNECTSTSKFSNESCVRSCISNYVSNFRGRVEVFRFENQIPVFPDNLLKEFHDQALQASKDVCGFFLKSEENKNTELFLIGVLENLFNRIRVRNSVRQAKLLEEIRTTEQHAFLKLLQEQFPSLHEDQNDKRTLGKFYDQTSLENFVKNTENLYMDRLDVLLGKALATSRTERDEKFETAKNSVLATARQFMAQERKRIFVRNTELRENLRKECQMHIRNLEDGLKLFQKNLSSNFFDDMENRQIKLATDNCKQTIAELCQTHALGNFCPLKDEYRQKADDLFAASAQHADEKRLAKLATANENTSKELSALVDRMVEEQGVPREEVVKSVQQWINNELSVKAGREPHAQESAAPKNVDANPSSPTIRSSRSDSPQTNPRDPRSPGTAHKRNNVRDKSENDSGKRSKGTAPRA